MLKSLIGAVAFYVYIYSTQSGDPCPTDGHLYCTEDMPDAKTECDCGFSSPLTSSDMVKFRAEIRSLFDKTQTPHPDPHPMRPLLATTVRLAFHDCAAGKEGMVSNPTNIACNGCININNPAHKGLEYAIDALQDVWETSDNDWDKKMSIADFWMLAATIGVEYGVDLAGKEKMPEIGYFCGRTDCSSAPFTNEMYDLPKGESCMKDIQDWFAPRFKFNSGDIVGLLGVHTLGAAHSTASGFAGPWTVNKDHFDNEWYLQLKGSTAAALNPTTPATAGEDVFEKWHQVIAPNTKMQWERINPTTNEPLMMLNADMTCERALCDAIIKDNDKGRIPINTNSCSGDNNLLCPFSATQSKMIQYVTSNQEFLDNFSRLFRSMINAGYRKGELCRIKNPFISSVPLTSSSTTKSPTSSSPSSTTTKSPTTSTTKSPTPSPPTTKPPTDYVAPPTDYVPPNVYETTSYGTGSGSNRQCSKIGEPCITKADCCALDTYCTVRVGSVCRREGFGPRYGGNDAVTDAEIYGYSYSAQSDPNSGVLLENISNDVRDINGEPTLKIGLSTGTTILVIIVLAVIIINNLICCCNKYGKSCNVLPIKKEIPSQDV